MTEPTTPIAGMSRRAFALGCTGAAALLALGGLSALPAEAQVRPPGGQDEDHLLSACIRCERCIEVCPKNALRPAHPEEGIFGVRTPMANFNVGWCDFCVEHNDGVPLCEKTCPTNALRLRAGATPETTILGKAHIIKDWCLAYRNAGCRFCYDACIDAGYDAIDLDVDKRPVVNVEKCVGCGACQSVCVSLKEGSIREGATSRAIIVVTEERLAELEGGGR